MKFQPFILAVAASIAFGACQSIPSPSAPAYRRDTKPRLAKELRVEPKNRANFKTPATGLAEGPHTLALMNFSTSWTCIAVSLDNAHWAAVNPPIGRTCASPASESDRCFNEGKFLPFGTVNCGKAISIWLKFRNAQGDIGTLTNPYRLIPDCQRKGTTFQFQD